MDRTLRLLLLSVMFLALHWRSAVFAPTGGTLDLSTLMDLTNLLCLETDQLLQQYTHYHGIKSTRAILDAPESSVNGTNVTDQLQDIHLKNVMFVQHIAYVSNNQQRFWNSPPSVAAPLSKVQHRLPHLSAKVRTLLQTASLPTPELVQHSYNRSYEAKEWLARVSLVLGEDKGPCDTSV
ncbi:uncharacterized protein ACB058_006689 isoform 2-T2 [Synchiropus picturatus]